MIDLLNARLADAIDLALITKQAHWNLKGPTFIAVHEMLDVLRADIDEHVDIIAERVAQLDGIALGTQPDRRPRRPSSPPYPTDIRKVADHLAALVERYAALSKSGPRGHRRRRRAGDADSRRHPHRLLPRARQEPVVHQDAISNSSRRTHADQSCTSHQKRTLSPCVNRHPPIVDMRRRWPNNGVAMHGAGRLLPV